VSETENPFLTVWVELNRHEVLAAAVGGCQRRVTSMEVARPQFYGADERNNFWQIDIQGAIAEFAVAKAFDKYWEPATDKSLKSLPGDVGFYQIRSTAHKTGQRRSLHSRNSRRATRETCWLPLWGRSKRNWRKAEVRMYLGNPRQTPIRN